MPESPVPLAVARDWAGASDAFTDETLLLLWDDRTPDYPRVVAATLPRAPAA